MAHRVAGDCPAADGRRRLCEVPRKAGSLLRGSRGKDSQGDHIAISSWRKAWCHPVPCCGASPTSARRWTGTSSAWAPKGEYLPDDSKLLFEVVCKGCRRTLVTVD